MGFWSSSSGSRHTSAWRRRYGVPKASTREHRTIRRASGLSRRQYRRVIHRNRAYT